MPRLKYQSWNPHQPTRIAINQAEGIAAGYAQQGYSLTLRQLYYRFIALDLFPEDRRWTWTGTRWVKDLNGTKNADPNYKWLGGVISNARMAGMLDWKYLIDRTRVLQSDPTWNHPAQILEGARRQYAEDLWKDQVYRVEVWVEKDALIDVVGRAAGKEQVPRFSCRGYTSQSAMWEAGQRMVRYLLDGQRPRVIHLGDHDPSGIDMSRDIYERLHLFIGSDPKVWEMCEEKGVDSPYELGEWMVNENHWPDSVMDDEDPDWSSPFFGVQRVALNMDQIRELNPPPSPAKVTDSRYESYVREFGDDSWELDALEPPQLNQIIQDAVRGVRDEELYEEKVGEQEINRAKIEEAIEGLRG